MLFQMRVIKPSLAAFGLVLAASAHAETAESRLSGSGPMADRYVPSGASEDEALPYLQCVPYARKVSGIQIYGDAWTWWEQAENIYARGNRPRVGAVMSFRPYGNMRLGHVAAVSRVIDSRTVLLRHANWSLIDGRRGQIEDNVRAVDVSDNNDWSAVRVWFAPIASLGTTRWPLNGFIYPEQVKPGKSGTVLASGIAPGKGPVRAVKPATEPKLVAAMIPPKPAAASMPRPVQLASAERPAASSRLGDDFLKGIRQEVPSTRPASRTLSAQTAPRQQAQSAKPTPTKPAATKPVPATRTASTQGTATRPIQHTTAPKPAAAKPATAQPTRSASAGPTRKIPQRGTATRSDDPIGRIIASRSR